MVQFARPDSDILNQGWTQGNGSALSGNGWSFIDEVPPPQSSTGDSVRSSSNPDGVSDDYECGLTDITDPSVGTGHVARAYVFKSGGKTIVLNMMLYQGSTLIAQTGDMSVTSTDFTATNLLTLTLTEAEANVITNYADLRLRFTPRVSGGGSGTTAYVALAELEVPDATAGTLFTLTSSDTITVVDDSVIRIANKNRAIADTTSLTDSISRIANKIRSISDTITSVTDSLVRVVVKLRSALDSITISDTLSRQSISFVRSASESIANVTDSIIRVADKIRSAVDSVPVGADTALRALTMIRSMLDTTTLSESVNRAIIAFTRTANDSITIVTDSVSRLVQLARSVADTVLIGEDSVVGAAIIKLYRTASDTIAVGTDTVQRAGILFARVVSESLTISDTVSRAGLALIRTSSDTITSITDSVVRTITEGAQTFIRTASDTVAIGIDVVARSVVLARAISDATASVSDAVIRVSDKIRTLSDALSVSDVVQRSWSGARQAIDTLPAIVDSVASSAVLILYRTASDTLSSATDSISRALNMTRNVADVIVTSDIISRWVNYGRTATDNLSSISDFVVRGSIVVRRAVQDSISFVSDIVSRIIGLPGYSGEKINIGGILPWFKTANDRKIVHKDGNNRFNTDKD